MPTVHESETVHKSRTWTPQADETAVQVPGHRSMHTGWAGGCLSGGC
jgi:hypothetical protein